MPAAGKHGMRSRQAGLPRRHVLQATWLGCHAAAFRATPRSKHSSSPSHPAGFGIQLAIALVTEAAASPQGALVDAAVMASATDVRRGDGI